MMRVGAPLPVRVQRVMARRGVDEAEALRRIAAYDGGVRSRLRQMFDLDWSDPLLYDLVVNTERMGLESSVRQVLTLAEAVEFQPSAASRTALEDQALVHFVFGHTTLGTLHRAEHHAARPFGDGPPDVPRLLRQILSFLIEGVEPRWLTRRAAPSHTVRDDQDPKTEILELPLE